MAFTFYSNNDGRPIYKVQPRLLANYFPAPGQDSLFIFLNVSVSFRSYPGQSAALSRLYIWPTILVHLIDKIAPNIKMVEVLQKKFF